MVRDRETECFGGLEIYRKLEFRGRLHWKVAWLRAFEDAVDIRGRIFQLAGRIDTIGQQTTVFHKEGVPINRGQPLALRRGIMRGNNRRWQQRKAR